MQSYFILFWEAIFWHSITEKYFMIWYSLENSIMHMFRIFQKVVRGGWENPPPSGRLESEVLMWEIFLPGEENLRRSDFDDSNLFQSWKQPSVKTKHQLKSKLTWPVCPKSMNLKQKWSRSNKYSYKCCFCLVITWKLLFSGG